MAEHKVGNLVVLTGTITEIDGDIAMVRVDKGIASMGTVAVRLGTLPAAPYDAVHGDQAAGSSNTIPMGCVCAYTWGMTENGPATMVRNGPRGDCPVHAVEDRIRDAMAEATEHPGREVTR